MVDVFKIYPKELTIAVCARLGTDVAFYTFALFILTYVTEELGLSESVGLNAVLIGSAFQLAFIPAFGAASDRFGRRPVYLLGAVGAVVWMFVFFPLLDTESSALIVLAAAVGLFFHAMMYGPQAAFLTELFGTRVRYSGASLGYQLAGVLGGALAPIISVALLEATGSSLSVTLYVVFALAITIGAVAISRETSEEQLEDTEKAEEKEIVEQPEAARRRLALSTDGRRACP